MSGSLLSPGFRSAAALAGWDEEALLFATLVVEDTPVREATNKKRRSPNSTNNSSRKRRSQRRKPINLPAVVLSLDDDDEEEKTIKDGCGGGGVKKEEKEGGDLEPTVEKLPAPCMERLKEELSCAICLEICFEPSTTPCGHSFCLKCLKDASHKCGRRCPKCRQQLISNWRSCTVNTVLWNTIQLLFPEEVNNRKKSKEAAPPPKNGSTITVPSERRETLGTTATAANTGVVRIPRVIRRERGTLNQSEDAALALRLQREEFMEAFVVDTEQHQRGDFERTRRENFRRRVRSYRFPYIID